MILGGIYKMAETNQEKYITYDQLNVINAIQKMWLKLEAWMKIYINASAFDNPILNTANNTLVNFSIDPYSKFSIFYGSENGQKIKNLAFDFVMAEMKVIEAVKNGDKILTDSRIINWYELADKISSFLASINIYWDEELWKHFLYDYIQVEIAQIYATFKGNYNEIPQLYDEIQDIIFIISNYMAKGIISSNLQQVTP